jgi:hypothetical protein
MRPPASRGHYQEDHDRHGDDRVDVSNAQKIKRWSCRQRPRTRGRRLRPQLQPAAPAEGLTGRVRRLAPRAARTTRLRHRLPPLTVGDGLASLGGCRPLRRDYDGVTREIWRRCTVPGSPPGGFAPLARWDAHRAFGGRLPLTRGPHPGRDHAPADDALSMRVEGQRSPQACLPRGRKSGVGADDRSSWPGDLWHLKGDAARTIVR